MSCGFKKHNYQEKPPGVYCHPQQLFNYIMTTRIIGGVEES